MFKTKRNRGKEEINLIANHTWSFTECQTKFEEMMGLTNIRLTDSQLLTITKEKHQQNLQSAKKIYQELKDQYHIHNNDNAHLFILKYKAEYARVSFQQKTENRKQQYDQNYKIEQTRNKLLGEQIKQPLDKSMRKIDKLHTTLVESTTSLQNSIKLKATPLALYRLGLIYETSNDTGFRWVSHYKYQYWTTMALLLIHANEKTMPYEQKYKELKAELLNAYNIVFNSYCYNAQLLVIFKGYYSNQQSLKRLNKISAPERKLILREMENVDPILIAEIVNYTKNPEALAPIATASNTTALLENKIACDAVVEQPNHNEQLGKTIHSSESESTSTNISSVSIETTGHLNPVKSQQKEITSKTTTTYRLINSMDETISNSSSHDITKSLVKKINDLENEVVDLKKHIANLTYTIESNNERRLLEFSILNETMQKIQGMLETQNNKSMDTSIQFRKQ